MFSKKRIFCLVHLILGCTLIIAIYFYLTNLFIPRFYSDTWTVTSTFDGFYKIPSDSIDVIFLGSSTGAAAFDPQVLEDNYSISSYNLSCEQQSMLISYYWLKEALKTQRPKVVILDDNMLFPNVESSPLNSQESFVRAAMDPMHWSQNKQEAIIDICQQDKSHTLMGYYIPIYRYHDRWKDIFLDFLSGKEKHPNLKNHKGYVYLDSNVDNEDYEPLYPEGVDHYTEMLPEMKHYLDLILNLCQGNNIHLLLVNTPSAASSYGVFNSVNGYANDNGINYINFNEYRFYHACNYNYSKDNAENSHANYRGAEKLTSYIGDVLKEVYFLE